MRLLPIEVVFSCVAGLVVLRQWCTPPTTGGNQDNLTCENKQPGQQTKAKKVTPFIQLDKSSMILMP